MRYFVAFSYFGKSYHGWQNQPNAITVQQVLEEAFSTLLRTPIALVGAGRTDTGVHAKQMYAHFNNDEIKDVEDLTFRLNSFLPDDVAVAKIFQVPDEAHARFDATERTYEYWVVKNKNPFHLNSAHYVKHNLDVDAMNKAASYLLKHTDFECFSKTQTDVRTYNCEIKQAVWKEEEDKLVFTIKADRFLRNMVRAIVGTLLDIGTGKMEVLSILKVLESKDRSKAGTSVPAKGLYLTRVLYPKTIIKIDE